MLWTLKILIFQHCFCLDITVLLENCCQKELVIIDILRSRESLLLWPCFNLFFFFYNFLLIIRRIGESGIMEPSMRSWGDMWLKSEPSEVQEAETGRGVGSSQGWATRSLQWSWCFGSVSGEQPLRAHPNLILGCGIQVVEFCLYLHLKHPSVSLWMLL